MDTNDDFEQNHVAECIYRGNEALGKDQLVAAATHFEQAFQVLQKAAISDSPELRQCLKTLAEIYLKRNKPDEALEFIRALRKLYDCTEYRRTYITLLSKIAAAHEKQGDREAAEKTYRDALAEASYLLPKNDPLTASLNKAGLEIFKRTIKSRQLTISDEKVILSNLTTDQAVEEAPEENSQPKILQSPATAKGDNSAKWWRVVSDIKLSAVLNSNTLSIGLSLLLMASIVKAAMFVPGIGTGKSAATAISKLQGAQFESCDKKTTFYILDKLQCVIQKTNLRDQCRYTVIGSNWQDVKSMLFGYLNRDELWYQVNESGVTDPDKTLLYRTGAPELTIVEKMWWYADFAQKWYQKKHCYPTDAAQCQLLEKNFAYSNPFTFHQDSAAIVSLRGMATDPSCSLRPKSVLAYPHWRPGGISCICLDGNKFFIHGYDRDGRPLTASDPQHFFVIECLDGANVTKAKLLKEDDEAKSVASSKLRRVYVFSRPEEETTIRYFRSCSCTLAWIWAILASLWCFSNYKLKQRTTLKVASTLVTVAACCALVGWYILAYAHD